MGRGFGKSGHFVSREFSSTHQPRLIKYLLCHLPLLGQVFHTVSVTCLRLTLQRYIQSSPPSKISMREETVWKVFGRCWPKMPCKRKLSPKKRKLFGRNCRKKRKELHKTFRSVWIIADLSIVWRWIRVYRAPRYAPREPYRVSTHTQDASIRGRPCARGRQCSVGTPRVRGY